MLPEIELCVGFLDHDVLDFFQSELIVLQVSRKSLARELFALGSQDRESREEKANS